MLSLVGLGKIILIPSNNINLKTYDYIIQANKAGS